MLRSLALAAALGALALPAAAQSLDLIGTVSVPVHPSGMENARSDIPLPATVGGSDVWGYTAGDGSEYAMIGTLNGLAVVAVPQLQTVATIAGPSEGDPFYHRDVKTYGSFAYAVTECTGPEQGLQVIDLRALPARAEAVAAIEGEGGRLVSSHNLTIDVQTGFAYVLNSDASAVVMVDLADPLHPRDVGQIDVPDSHDVFARRDTLWIAEGRSPTFSMWDVSDKAAPRLIVRSTVPQAGYVHNIWPSDDGKTAFTTEETVDKTVKVWDMTDATDPTLVGEWLGSSRLAHNVLVRGRYAFLSHYAAGVYVLDVSDAKAPREVAHVDTFPANDAAAFYGTWGATLPSPGGYVYGSDIEGKLTVLRWQPPVNG